MLCEQTLCLYTMPFDCLSVSILQSFKGATRDCLSICGALAYDDDDLPVFPPNAKSVCIITLHLAYQWHFGLCCIKPGILFPAVDAGMILQDNFEPFHAILNYGHGSNI